MSRYGDGELSMMMTKGFCIGFQHFDSQLTKKLWDTMLSHRTRQHIICLPRPIIHRAGLTPRAVRFWRRYSLDFTLHLLPILNRGCNYFDALCTRPYMGYSDTSYADAIFDKWKKVWRERNLLLVEGEKSRLGVGNDLFDEASSIRRILIPSTNAYASYNKIVESILEHYQTDDLVLLAAGPTATVLAYELSSHGIQALDIGHIDVEYCWSKMKVRQKVPLPGKWVNETGGYTPCDEKLLQHYKETIVDVVS